MITPDLLAQLANAGLLIMYRQSGSIRGWFAGEGGAVGPFRTPEEALIAGVYWLQQQCYKAIGDCDAIENVFLRLHDQPPEEPPEPFKHLLG